MQYPVPKQTKMRCPKMFSQIDEKLVIDRKILVLLIQVSKTVKAHKYCMRTLH